MNVQEMERAIAEKIVDDALSLGYKISVNDGDGEDVPDVVSDSSDRAQILAAMFTTGSDELWFYNNEEDAQWVLLVYGNDGHDVIADSHYTDETENLLKGAVELANQFDEYMATENTA